MTKCINQIMPCSLLTLNEYQMLDLKHNAVAPDFH